MGLQAELIALFLLLAVNRLALPRFALIPAVFWTITGLDLGGTLAVWLPGVEDQLAVRALVSVVLVFHAVQNFAVRSSRREQAEEPARRRERLAALKSASEAEREPPQGNAEG